VVQIRHYAKPQTDLEEMTWFESRDYSINLGNRWRLPNKLELDEMYKLHLKAVGNFKFEIKSLN
jgi:hypothetical protein